MTLREYLASPQAVDDVRRLLTTKPARSVASEPSAFWWVPRGESGLWRCIELQHVPLDSRSPTTKNLNVYYRPVADRFIVSDCGETVSAIMRRTGKSWQESLKILHRAECLTELDRERDGDVMLDGVEDVAQAIVTALSIVAKARESQP